jgi:hypothetical protein
MSVKIVDGQRERNYYRCRRLDYKNKRMFGVNGHENGEWVPERDPVLVGGGGGYTPQSELFAAEYGDSVTEPVAVGFNTFIQDVSISNLQRLSNFCSVSS